MKEIKFRAWDKEKKRFLSKFGISAHGRVTQYGTSISHHSEIELMQFTGLLDKNGKEIFEGDIVRCHQFTQELGENLGVYEGEKETVCVVTYIEENTCFGFVEINSEDRGYIEPALCSDEGIEIIGNIHENPELLNKKE